MKKWRWIGWIAAPFIMLIVRWNKTGKLAKSVGILWSGVLGTAVLLNLGLSFPSHPLTGGIGLKPSIGVQLEENHPNRIQAKVLRVVDGDTLQVEVNGKKESLRMLLVDTPETKHPSKPIEPFGPEAAAYTKEQLEGRVVELEKDVSERDRYGRLLMYVYVEGRLFQEQLLELGLARVAVFPPDVKYVEAFRAIQKKAQEAEVGIWSIENYATDRGFDSKNVEIEVKNDPEQEVYYKSCMEAKAAGAAPLHKGAPGYRTGLDRDGDGVACER